MEQLKFMKTKQIIAIALVALLLGGGIYSSFFTEDKPNVTKPNPNVSAKPEAKAPTFDGDSALAKVAQQVDFGPRVPNSKGHDACGAWLVSELTRLGAKITTQDFSLKAYDETPLRLQNIMASFQPEKTRRILLCAHWDTRHMAEKDPDPARRNKPILGANDGGSGVAVLLEIARHLQTTPTGVGIDLLFLDGEDYGASDNVSDDSAYLNPGFYSTWCLGSQYWAKNKMPQGYNPMFGILLDMVGAADAQFCKEKFSMEVAGDLVNLVWANAEKEGYGMFFQDREVNGVIDDHVMLNRGGVRCIDIIDTRPIPASMGLGEYTFPSYHHTHKDDMSRVSKNTLKAVGQTVLRTIYNM
jgi:glutaminyl-peptide cyclotransferase